MVPNRPSNGGPNGRGFGPAIPPVSPATGLPAQRSVESFRPHLPSAQHSMGQPHAPVGYPSISNSPAYDSSVDGVPHSLLGESSMPVGNGLVRAFNPAQAFFGVFLGNTAIPADATEASPENKQQTTMLAGCAVGAVAASLLPLFLANHQSAGLPSWALGILLLALVQAAYAIWMATAPDLATVRVMMLVSSSIAAIYALLVAMTLVTPADRTLVLGLSEVRRGAPLWCALMVLAMGALSWACSRVAGRWSRFGPATQEVMPATSPA